MPIAEPEFDLQLAHRHFAAQGFNVAWQLLEQPSRTAAESQLLLEASYASLWHWRERADCNSTRLSVGYWQLSRIYAVLERTSDAERYGQLALECAEAGAAPFYRAYAYEALARASALAGDPQKCRERLAQALSWAEGIQESESRQLLLDDLASIGPARLVGG